MTTMVKRGSLNTSTLIVLCMFFVISYGHLSGQIMMQTEFVVSSDSVVQLSKKTVGELCPKQYRNNDLLGPIRKLDFFRGPDVKISVEIFGVSAPYDYAKYPNLIAFNYSSVLIAKVSFEAVGEPKGLGALEGFFEALGELVTGGALNSQFDNNTCDNPAFSNTAAKSFDTWEIVIAGIIGSGNPRITHVKSTSGLYESKIRNVIMQRMPDSGGEFLGCNDGEIYSLVSQSLNPFSFEPCGSSTSNRAIWQLDVIGDTGAQDVNTDNDCGCDSRIDNLVLNDLELFVSIPDLNGIYDEPTLAADDSIYIELRQFYCNTNGNNWNNNTNWLSSPNPCDWYGINCDENNNITGIFLGNNNLSGYCRIPNIPSLVEFDVNNNDLNMSGLYVPNHIKFLTLADNPNLDVNIVVDCAAEHDLQSLDLRNCAGFSGDLVLQNPNLLLLDLTGTNQNNTSLDQMNLPNLQFVSLAENNLTRIPSGLYNSPLLYLLHIDNNDITEINDSITQFANLVELNLEHNDISSLSAGIGKLSNLQYLYLGRLAPNTCFPATIKNLCSGIIEFSSYYYDDPFYYPLDQNDLCNGAIDLHLCSCENAIKDFDQDGFCSDTDCNDSDPTIFPLAVGTPCDDGDPNTFNDRITGGTFGYGCNCSGNLGIDSDGDGIRQEEDCNDNDPNIPGIPGDCCDDGNDFTVNDRFNEDGCGCEGRQYDAQDVEIVVDPNSSNCEGQINVVLEAFAINIRSYEPRIDYTTYQVKGNLGECINVRSGSQTGLSEGNIDYSLTFPDGSQHIGNTAYDHAQKRIQIEAPSITSGGVLQYRITGTVSHYDVNGISATIRLDIVGSYLISEDACGCETDIDQDGTCASEDCNDNDPNVPGLPGMICQEGNEFIPYGILMEDGCTCDIIPKNCENLEGNLPETVYLGSQQEVDNFVNLFPCSSFFGSIFIYGNVTNLNGLQSLVRIYGDLTFSDLSLVNALMPNLKFVNNLNISGEFIANLDFSSLEIVNGTLEIRWNNLTTLSSFNNLHTIWSDLIIQNEPELTSLTAFSSLDIIGGSLKIINTGLSDISSFDQVSIMGPYIEITNNPILSNCNIIPVCYRLFKYDNSYIIHNNMNNGNCISPTTVRDQCGTRLECVHERVVDYPLDYNLEVKAGKSIKASNTVLNNAMLYLKAGEDVELQPDFWVLPGSALEINMEECGLEN